MKTNTLKNQYIRLFAESGFRLCPLGHKEEGEERTDFSLIGKIPPFGFTKIRLNPLPDVRKFPVNYGIVLDANHLVIDVDPRNFPEGRDVWEEFQTDFCVRLEKICTCIVRTGGGGLHLYFKKPPGLLIRNDLKEYPGIEFKSKGRQVVGPGSMHPDTAQPYTAIGILFPRDLVALDADIGAAIKKEDVKLDNGLADYDDSDGNRTLVAQSLADHPAAVEGQRGDDITFQAAALCRDGGVSPDVALELLETYNGRCDPPWSIDGLAQKVKNAYRYAQNAVGSKNPKTDFDAVEDKVEPAAPKDPTAVPEFLDDIKNNWCFSIGSKEFFKLSTMRSYDKEQFDDIHAGKTDRKKPSAFAIQHEDMPKVELPTYWPGQPRYITENGEPRINMYKAPTLIPKRGDVAPFKEFVEYLVGPDKAWMIHDFVAYLLQNPGEKVLWAILLQGKPGVGKSLLARAMVKLFGRHNVSQPTNKQVHEKYTTWLKSCQLVVVHELMAMGRLEMLNTLKDPITEPTITVREMFKPAYEITNRANFLFLTNHEDSIVIPKDDRRFGIIFSKAEKREPEYYDGIVDWMDKNMGALLHYYLHDHEFDAQFKPKAPAPMTSEKQKMINATRHPVECAILDMLEDEKPPMHGALADITAILDALKNQHRGLNYLSLAMYMKNCGFVSVGERMRLKDGRRVRLWAVRKIKMLEDLEPEKLKSLFEQQEADLESNTDDGILSKVES